MDSLHYSESIVVARPPEALYDMVSDVTRMGEWSPVCKACWWDEGDGPRPGAWFTGRNELPERTWETRSQIEVAERGREFAFLVGGAWVRWAYTFTPVEGGTQVTESWEFLPAGITRFHERFGDDAEAQITSRTKAAHQTIPLTLAALKHSAESPNCPSPAAPARNPPVPAGAAPQQAPASDSRSRQAAAVRTHHPRPLASSTPSGTCP